MEVGAKIEIISYQSYDPLYARIKVNEGKVEKGDYLPDLGVVEQIWKKTNDGYDEINQAERDGDYVIRAKVTEQGYIRLKPALQFNILKQLTERLHSISCVLTETFAEKEALSDEVANSRVMRHRPPEMGKGKGWMIDL